MLPNNKSSSASASDSDSVRHSRLWPEMAFTAQTNVPAFYCLYNTEKTTEKIRKKINQLWHFSHRRQTRNISMRKSPKIVSIVGFLPAFSLTLPLSLSRGKRSSVISFQLGRQFSKNEAHTTKPKGNPTENELDLARKPQGRRRTGESTTPAMGKWLLWCFGNMCKQLRRTEQEEEAGGGSRSQISLALLTRLFREVCTVCLSDFSSIRMSQRAANVRRYNFFGCPLKEHSEQRSLKPSSGSSN